MRIYRLCKERYSATVLAGDGGLHADGRWHSVGRRIVYCASSESLAVLELRVHVGNFLPREPFVMHAIEVPDTFIETLPSTLPVGWNVVPHSQMSQAVGDAWLVQRRFAALRVPSVHSNTEFNVLLNPLHDRMSSVRVDTTRKYGFDPRLFAG